MPYHSIVLMKQVPDTAAITDKALNPDGTLNRAALQAICNPECLHALEMALQVKDRYGGLVTVLTMGPPRAADILRDALYRGADRAILLTDRLFAGSDTLATSYVLALALVKVGAYDLIFCGRQAIDGDTGQVGPELAQRLDLQQITYAEEILSIPEGHITAQRELPLGRETVACPLPCLLTVVGGANRPRPPSVRRVMTLKLAATPLEYPDLLRRWPEFGTTDALDAYLGEHGLRITQWSAADIGAEAARLGLAGSPTKVLQVGYVGPGARVGKAVSANDEGLTGLIYELVADYIL